MTTKIKNVMFISFKEEFMKPYIGATGFTSVEQIAFAMSSVLGREIDDYLLMIGILVSHKTLRGEKNKWPKRYPLVEELPNLMLKSDRLLNLIHYNTHTQAFVPELEQLINMSGPNLHGFQLNICWPDPKELERFRNNGNAQSIVLQIGGNAFRQINHSPKQLAEKLENEYVHLIDYVLLDPSGGFGQAMDINKADQYLDELYWRQLNEHLVFGVAGGLSGYNIHELDPLIMKYDQLCVDAEGRLRNIETDDMVIDEMVFYLKQAQNFVVGLW